MGLKIIFIKCLPKKRTVYTQYEWHFCLCLFSLLRPPTITLPHLSHVIRRADVAFFVVGYIYGILDREGTFTQQFIF